MATELVLTAVKVIGIVLVVIVASVGMAEILKKLWR